MHTLHWLLTCFLVLIWQSMEHSEYSSLLFNYQKYRKKKKNNKLVSEVRHLLKGKNSHCNFSSVQWAGWVIYLSFSLPLLEARRVTVWYRTSWTAQQPDSSDFCKKPDRMNFVKVLHYQLPLHSSCNIDYWDI